MLLKVPHFVERVVVLQVDLVEVGVLLMEALGPVVVVQIRHFYFDWRNYFVVEVFEVVRWEKRRRELEGAKVLLLEIQVVHFLLASLPAVLLSRMQCR